MQNDLMQKARANRTKALNSRKLNREFCFESHRDRRLPEIRPTDVVALFDSTQWHFAHTTWNSALQTA